MICFTCGSCTTTNKIFTEDDIVYSVKRFELKYDFKDRDRRTPLLFFTQAIVKEVNSKNEVSYSAYDVLYFSSSGFKPDDKAILIIDNEAFPMTISRMESEYARTITEDKSDIATSDSTTISVVTGYSENNRKIFRFSYRIPDSAMMKIKDAEELYIRYYSGPSMITVKPKKKSLKRIRQLIDII